MIMMMMMITMMIMWSRNWGALAGNTVTVLKSSAGAQQPTSIDQKPNNLRADDRTNQPQPHRKHTRKNTGH